MGRTASLALCLLFSASALSGQEAPASADRPDGARPRQVTILGGMGNSLGWLGAQAEWYFGGDRFSTFGALGYTPELEDGDPPEGITFAAGVRGYTAGAHHRGLLELSISQIAVQVTSIAIGLSRIAVGGERLYGPGLQAGYQFSAAGGFTLLVSAGAGYAVGLDDDVDESHVQPMLNLGFGYTWR